MDLNRLTVKSQEAVAAAQERARRLGNPELYPEHLLLALLDQELARTLVERSGYEPDSLRAEAEERLASKPRLEGVTQQPTMSAALSKVLDRAFDEARQRLRRAQEILDELGWKTWKRPLPEVLALYMATSASRISSSADLSWP